MAVSDPAVPANTIVTCEGGLVQSNVKSGAAAISCSFQIRAANNVATTASAALAFVNVSNGAAGAVSALSPAAGYSSSFSFMFVPATSTGIEDEETEVRIWMSSAPLSGASQLIRFVVSKTCPAHCESCSTTRMCAECEPGHMLVRLNSTDWQCVNGSSCPAGFTPSAAAAVEEELNACDRMYLFWLLYVILV